MKKALTLLLCLLLLCGCGARPASTEEALAELEENCDIPYALGSRMSESRVMEESQEGVWGEYRYTPGWGGFWLESGDVALEMCGWPDVTDPYCVTRFRLKSQRYSLFGLRVGCGREEADRVLTGRGYVPAAENSVSKGYTKGDVWLGVEWDNTLTVWRLTASIPSTNVDNVDF